MAGKIFTVVFLLSWGWLAARGELVDPGVLLRDPPAAAWAALSRYDGTLTRGQFEERLHGTFDPFGGLAPFLAISDREVLVYASPAPVVSGTAGPLVSRGEPLARIQFAASSAEVHPGPELAKLPGAFRPFLPTQPLAGLRIVIEPADIGGRWGPLEDRSSFYRGYGKVQEGDLNLVVAGLLEERLRALGAKVYVTREATEPVSGLQPAEVSPVVPAVLLLRPYLLPAAFRSRTTHVSHATPAYQQIAAEVLLTKNLEALARAEKTRRMVEPDLTVVLQFDATPSSGRAGLASLNRNIFFIEGAYTAKEVQRDANQRLRLLTKLLANVTPTETAVAVKIAQAFKQATGYPPVRYGDTAVTRKIADCPYVVARNLALSRQHDGPVVVVEPYFMNEAVTLLRLLAGDYDGVRVVAGAPRMSIYREYADTVARGLAESYGSAKAALPGFDFSWNFLRETPAAFPDFGVGGKSFLPRP